MFRNQKQQPTKTKRNEIDIDNLTGAANLDEMIGIALEITNNMKSVEWFCH